MAQTVFVGLSGGVDSAVSAALLKERGCNVVGAFIKIWQPEFIECTWKEDRIDAMRVAVALGIPFREIDCSAEYKREVIDRMLTDYRQGITPNPDVLCNRYVKFGIFATWAREMGAERVATGHYARITQDGGHYELRRGADGAKDQSYFLHRLTQADLARAIFPIGEMRKHDVRKAAERMQLPVAKKADSQGLCFVGEVSMRDFLSRFISVRSGEVRSLSGEPIGEHDGAAFYTVGQRHGFSIAGERGRLPHYAVRIDAAANIVYASERKADAMQSVVTLQDEHWIHRAPHVPAECDAQARYHEQPVRVTIERAAQLRARMSEPHLLSPGQSLVLYDGDVCLGGARIAPSDSVHSSA